MMYYTRLVHKTQPFTLRLEQDRFLRLLCPLSNCRITISLLFHLGPKRFFFIVSFMSPPEIKVIPIWTCFLIPISQWVFKNIFNEGALISALPIFSLNTIRTLLVVLWRAYQSQWPQLMVHLKFKDTENYNFLQKKKNIAKQRKKDIAKQDKLQAHVSSQEPWRISLIKKNSGLNAGIKDRKAPCKKQGRFLVRSSNEVIREANVAGHSSPDHFYTTNKLSWRVCKRRGTRKLLPSNRCDNCLFVFFLIPAWVWYD